MATTNEEAVREAFQARLRALGTFSFGEESPGQGDAFRAEVQGLIEAAAELGFEDLRAAFLRLADLIEVWECLLGDDPSEWLDQRRFLDEAIERLTSTMHGADSLVAVDWVLHESAERWGQYLDLVGEGGEPDAAVWTPESPADELPLALDHEALLRQLIGSLHEVSGASPPAEEPCTTPDGGGSAGRPTEASSPAPETPATHSGLRDSEPLAQAVAEARNLCLEDEVRDVFLADLEDLLGRIQEHAVALGSSEDPARHRGLRGCFHTLKGAAGTVGLTELAKAVHRIEDQLEDACGRTSEVLAHQVEQSLAMIEAVVAAIRDRTTRGRGVLPEAPDPGQCRVLPDLPASPTACSPADPAEGFLRISATSLEALIDQVSELVIRRRLGLDQGEKVGRLAMTATCCAQRLRTTIERLVELPSYVRDAGRPLPPRTGETWTLDLNGLICRLGEQCDDLEALAAAAREVSVVLTDEGESVARLVMQVWDRLQDVRLMTMSHLLHRLVRAAHEAARAEGKKVAVQLEGETIKADRPLLDRAFEPLLHIVRNAVSHGIEPPAQRESAGKPAIGRISITARREGNQLELSVQDDGRGLDEEAILAKARRLGLVSPSEPTSSERIRSLIFEPGFSTREVVGSVAGRGVGMDVVAREVGFLRGRIDLESRPGHGLAISLRLPARLSLEPVVVFRVVGRLFSLPVPAVQAICSAEDPPPLGGKWPGPFGVHEEGAEIADLRLILDLADPQTTPPCPKVLVARVGSALRMIPVDSVESTGEMVVKSLGPLLASHPLLSGASLSPGGEVVLALDLAGLFRSKSPGPPGGDPPTARSRIGRRTTRALVVDDSLSVRRSIQRILWALGFEVDEAADGEQALGLLHASEYGLIVTDLEMPKLDGFELLAELGRTGVLERSRVIVSSSGCDRETQARIRRLGVPWFLPKPIAVPELVRLAGAQHESLTPIITSEADLAAP